MRTERSLILETSVGVVFHATLLFSMFLLFSGHNAPGGGFVGGLVAGAALVLCYVEGGARQVRAIVPVAPETLLAGGLGLALLTGAVPLVLGGELLQSAKLALDLPLLGSVKATSALPFDIGVYLVVVGLVLGVLRTLGAEET